MAEFGLLGARHKSWEKAVIPGGTYLDGILPVIDEAKKKTKLVSYFGATFSEDRTLPRKGRRRLASNGPYGTITTVQTTRSPAEAEKIRPFSCQPH